MNILHAIVNFVLDMWLWNMTWGWYQMALSFVFMWIFTVFMGRMKSGSALLLILGSYTTVFCIYSLFVVGVLIYWFQWQYIIDTKYAPMPTNVLVSSLYLGIVYTLLQTLFFTAVSKRFCLVLPVMVVVTAISNTVAALLATYFIYALVITP